MQRQRSTVEPYSETLDLDLESTTNNSMDQRIVWNNLAPNTVAAQNLPDYLLSLSDTGIPYMNATSQEGDGLSIWNSGTSGSSEHPLNRGHSDVTTNTGNERASSLIVTDGGGPGTEERQLVTTSRISSGNININLNIDQPDIGQPFSQNFTSTNLSHNLDQNVGNLGLYSQVYESGLYPHPFTSGASGSGHVLSGGSSNTSRNSSRMVGFFSEDNEDRPNGSGDSRHLSSKRMNIEDIPEHSSASGSSTSFHQNDNISVNTNLNISRSSDFLSGGNPSQLIPRVGTSTGVISDSIAYNSIPGHQESPQRNSRMNTNHAEQHPSAPTNLWPPAVTTTLNNPWSTNQQIYQPIIQFHHLANHQSPQPVQANQTLVPRPLVGSASSQSQLHLPVNTGLHRNVRPRIEASNSRISGSSSSPINVGEILPAPREETRPRRMPRNVTSTRSIVHRANEIRQPVQVPPNSVLANGNEAVPGDMVPESRAGPRSSAAVSRALHQNSPAYYNRSLVEAVRRASFSTSSSLSAGQTSNATPQRSLQIATSQDIVHHPGAGLLSNTHAHMRTILMDRQREGTPGGPVHSRASTSSRDGRNRMISEHIRNMLDFMRRGENLQFEDIYIFDQSVFLGGANLHDRHRDMRLDVDNMSYEELLALEERIGTVNTGLSEEMVLKCLKHRKYTSVTFEASTEVEPCCICQEEYADADELGTLDCGHDFHSDCIKQWLMQKNLCPICKTTALSKT